MSATNRGSERIEQDYYPTPIKSFLPLIPYIKGLPHIAYSRENDKDLKVWEPASGDDRLIKCMNEYGIASNGDDLSNGYDFLKDDSHRNCIITNPPFSIAQEFIEHARKHSNEIFMLLRMGFLASEKRKQFWMKNKPSALFILSSRPNFVISVKCKNKNKENPCETPFNQIFQFDQEELIPKNCPCCGEKLTKTSSDSSEYAWYYWGQTYDGLYWI